MRTSHSLGGAVLDGIARLSLLAALAAVLGYAGAWHWLLDLCAHFRWQYLAVMLIGLSAALVRRRAVLAVLLVLVSVLNAWSLSTATGPLLPGPAITQAEHRSSWSLLLVNIHVGNPDLSALLALIERESPDVIGVLELSPQAASALSGLSADYPMRHLDPRADPFGIGLWSRLPGSQIEAGSISPMDLPIARLEWGSERGGTLWLIHPFPPIGAQGSASRDAQLGQVAELVGRDPSAIVAGDLNTTPWSSAYRRLRATTGLLDSSAGSPPWPTWSGSMLGPALAVPIDHVLHGSQWRVLDHAIGPDVGSDHRPILVRFAAAVSGQ